MSEPLAFVEGPFGRIGLVAMDTGLALHVHHHVHLIVKAGGADTAFQVRGRRLPVTDDRAVLVDAWEPHCWSRDRSLPPTLFLTFYLEPDWVGRCLGVGPGEGAGLFAEPGIALDGPAIRAIRGLVDVMTALAPGGAAAAPAGGTAALIAALLGAVVAPRTGRRIAAAQAGRLQDHRIRRAFALLRSGESAELDRVAREVGLSRPRFFELFRACTGVTPRSVIHATRMEQAIDLLTHSAVPLGEMAADLGYASQGNLTRFFKQQIGICPTSYRRAAFRARA